MRVAVLIDGGHLRIIAKQAGKLYNPTFIENVARACVDESETALRYLYYDCKPFNGTVQLPVSGNDKLYSMNAEWLNDLAKRDLFAVRLGVLKFRGFKPRVLPIGGQALTDNDFAPDFEQKGVDMRIGLDIASHAERQSVDRLILVTNDTDCVPAMKLARLSGLQIVLASFPNTNPASELLHHTDFKRAVAWPD